MLQEINNKDIARYLDHAVLDPSLTKEELKEKIMIGVKYHCKMICVNPTAIEIAKECIEQSETGICVVCDFPFGASTTISKCHQVQDILENDIDEVDVVANYGKIREKDYAYVIEEIRQIKEICQKKQVILKVIVETDALSKEDILKATECCIKAGADYIKTSTGYYKGEQVGASFEVIQLIMSKAKGKIKVKGSGCVRSRDHLLNLIDLGIDRAGVGYSSTSSIMGEEDAK